MKALAGLSVTLLLVACGPKAPPPTAAAPPPPPSCPTNDSGLSLAPGFCATVFADNLGHARHLVVSPQGVVYVNTWSGLYYGNDKPPDGGFLIASTRRNVGAGKCACT